jgi:hypothetical protein
VPSDAIAAASRKLDRVSPGRVVRAGPHWITGGVINVGVLAVRPKKKLKKNANSASNGLGLLTGVTSAAVSIDLPPRRTFKP